MRFVQKRVIPDFFVADTKSLLDWSDYYSTKKRVLKEYILKNEQSYLCIYCESKISIDNSHIEHIKPKDKYSKLTFSYTNLAVSCNGNCHNKIDDNRRYNCGHIKNNEYNETKFLNPIKLVNIRNYFKYDIDTLTINSSDKNFEKANYMINTLHLNSGSLKVERVKIYKKFKQEINKIKDISKRKKIIKQRLDKEDIEQISFLRYIFKHLI